MPHEKVNGQKSSCWRSVRFWLVTFLLSVVLLAGIFPLATASEQKPSKRPLASLRIEGNQALSRSHVHRALRLKTGRRTTEEKLEQAFFRLRDTYRNKGYLEVNISTRVTLSSAGWVSEIRIEEGSVFHLQTLTVHGNKSISSKHIARELEMKPGDPFNPNSIIEGNRRLYVTGCFEAVNVVMSTSAERGVHVVVNVRERRQRYLKGSAGYGTETKERLSLGLEDQNFLGGARRADLKYTYSGFLTAPEKNETRSLEANLIQPFIFGTRMQGQGTMERSRKFREAYDSIESEFRANLERRFRAAFSIRLTYRFQGTEYTRISPEAETPSQTNVNALGASLRYDNTGDPFLPFAGWRALGSVEEGLQMFSNDVGFHRVEGRLGRFDTIESGWTFFEGFQGGVMFPRSGETADAIPINERFFLGGANTVRGYSERSLGPKDDNGDPLGGTLFLVTNVELRHKIYKRVFGVAFFDMGNLFYAKPGDSNPYVNIDGLDDLKKSWGLGTRLHSPVGAIRLEGGYQLNPEGSTAFSERTALHFSIGEVF